MAVPSDLDIARSVRPRPIADIAHELGLRDDEIELYGSTKAKVTIEGIRRVETERGRGKYVVVTAITPTPLGEGKSTTTVGLAQGLNVIGKKAAVAIRQPSLGPVFGIKGGAAGGGYSQVIPMEDFNLHLTGDVHAIGAAHNLAAAFVDNHVHHGNELGIDPNGVLWPRVVDISDRALRDVVVGLGGKENGYPRQTQFVITVASEVMAILALASDLQDLRARLGRVVLALRRDGSPITAEDLKVAGAMTVLLRDALKPNLLQTLEGGPAWVHCGPFANIAHGNSSVLADRAALATSEILVTEAGFGADMGAEKFFDIKCRASGLKPDAAVIVATIRALKMHGGVGRIVAGKPLDPKLLEPNPDAVRAGGANLAKQIENVAAYGVPSVVAINLFPTDTDAEVEAIREVALAAGARDAVVARHFTDGGAGAADLATAVWEAAEAGAPDFQLLYPDDDAAARQDRGDRHPHLRRRRDRRPARRRQAARPVRVHGLWVAADLHGQDPVQPQPRREAAGPADGLPGPDPRGPPVRGRRLRDPDPGRHAHDARPQLAPGRRADRHRRRRERRRALLAPYPRPMIVQALVALAGILLIARTVFSAVRTFVVPRGENDQLSRVLFTVVRRAFNLAAPPSRSYAQRDRVMAYYGPVALMLLPAFWLVLLVLGFGAIYWALGMPVTDALEVSGSSLLTLGFFRPSVVYGDIVSFIEAALGLALVALLISYLPTIYSAFSRRELLVSMLEVRADSPPSPVVMITRMQRLHGLGALHGMWDRWEQWFAEVEETHSSLPVLVFYRSQQPSQSWVNAAGAIMDAAAIVRSSVAIPMDVQADLAIRSGYLCLRRICTFFRIQYAPDPSPGDPISIDRERFERALDVLAEAGVPLVADRDQAWLDYSGWRVNYDTVLRALERLTMAPTPWWELPMRSALETDDPGNGERERALEREAARAGR